MTEPTPLQTLLDKAGSDLERTFLSHLWEAGERTFQQQGNTPYVRGTGLKRPSRASADFLWPDEKIAVEVAGGTFGRKRGKYNTGAGLQRLFRKINDAQLDGWLVLVFDAPQVQRKEALKITQEALEVRRDRFKALSGPSLE